MMDFPDLFLLLRVKGFSEISHFNEKSDAAKRIDGIAYAHCLILCQNRADGKA